MGRGRWRMDNSKEKIKIDNRDLAIVFNGGTYGNFINWTLNWLQGIYDTDSKPWGEYGNSHKYDMSKGYVKVHPANYDCTLNQFIKNLFVDYNFKKVLFIHPTKNTMLWNLNNKFFKIWVNKGYFKHFYDTDPRWKENLVNWKKDFDSLETWELREYLSLSMMNNHLNEIRNDEIETISFDNFLKISIEDLTTEEKFYTTLDTLIDFCLIDVCRSNHEISQLYNEWLSLQEFINKDKLIESYIHAIVNQIDMKFENLTIVDEAEIQRVLREKHNMQIKCYNLNTWPESTLELNKLLYKDEDDESAS